METHNRMVVRFFNICPRLSVLSLLVMPARNKIQMTTVAGHEIKRMEALG